MQKLVAEFYADAGIGEYATGEAANILGTPEAKVDMIAAGAVLMMKRLADTHRVHILDCMLAVPKWTALLVSTELWEELKCTSSKTDSGGAG